MPPRSPTPAPAANATGIDRRQPLDDLTASAGTPVAVGSGLVTGQP